MKKDKKIRLNILIVLSLLIIILASTIGLYAWSKYTSSSSGDATAQVAKWNFKLKGNSTAEAENTNFAVTRTDSNTSVETGKLAPGTNGKFEMVVDTTGTEVSLVYDIVLTLTNCPQNLLFYKDAGYQNELPKVSDNGVDKLYIKEYVPVSEDSVKNGQHNEILYWRWKYETGTRSWEKDNNDEQDTNDKGKTMTMKIVATGTEVMQEPTYTLEELVRTAKIQIGDEVDYNAVKESGISLTNANDTTYIATADKTGRSENQTFNVESNMKWRVLSRNAQKGTIEIISENGTTNKLALYGQAGFINSKEVLDEIGKIYSYGEGAEEGSGRSIDIGDIEKYSSYEPETYLNSKVNCYCGETYTYNSGTFIKERIDKETGEVIGYENQTEQASSNHPVTMHATHYWYTAQKNFFANQEKAYEVLFKNSEGQNKNIYWLASRSVFFDLSSCSFDVRSVNDGVVAGYSLYNSDGNSNYQRFCCLPSSDTKIK